MTEWPELIEIGRMITIGLYKLAQFLSCDTKHTSLYQQLNPR